LYGPGGNGGAINIITKKGIKGTHGSVTGELGSEDARIGRFTFSAVV
jgi:outer membrane receptor for ferrienterochelin and colicin